MLTFLQSQLDQCLLQAKTTVDESAVATEQAGSLRSREERVQTQSIFNYSVWVVLSTKQARYMILEFNFRPYSISATPT